MRLSVIIPAYNESARIIKTLVSIIDCLNKKGFSYEIIVIDDGSFDNTVELITDFVTKTKFGLRLIKNEKNRGKGYSVRKGVASASGEYILFSDADLSTPIDEFDRLMNELNNGFDIAIGSRAVAGSEVLVHQTVFREFMGKVFNMFVKALVMPDYNDTQCGFKLFKAAAAKDIFKRQQIEGFSFDVEILYIAKRSGYSVKETPIKWINSPNTKVDTIKDPVKMFFDLLAIRRLHK